MKLPMMPLLELWFLNKQNAEKNSIPITMLIL